MTKKSRKKQNAEREVFTEALSPNGGYGLVEYLFLQPMGNRTKNKVKREMKFFPTVSQDLVISQD